MTIHSESEAMMQVNVTTVPVNKPCEDCGKSPALKWSIAGIGSGVLCKDCLQKITAEINEALKDKK